MKSKTKISNFYCDVLIIGSGSAGLRAAIEAHDAGAHVLIISRSKKGDPHTVLARGGINAALGTMDPEDSWMVHAADTLREGELLADYERVEVLCKNATDAVNELVSWGARFHREEDGRLTQRFFGAHKYRRTVFYEDWTGQEIIRVLMEQVLQRRIEIMDNVYIIKILKKDDVNGKGSAEEENVGHDEVKGALGMGIETREIIVFECKSLILATGGYTRVYSVSSSRISENYGEGIALAYEAGSDLVDMEMVQFHPTGMVWPDTALGTLATEAIRGEGGILLNSKGERFMKNYYPKRMELGPRDIVARAIYNGRGTEHGGVWLDVTHLSKEKILDRLPTMYKQFKKINGIDISEEKMEVGPTAHYSMGGVVVDMKCRTKVKGLFAVGETISQIHGANRLGGNSLLDTLVFGKIVGAEAAKFMKELRDKGKIGGSPSPLQLNFNDQKGFEDQIFEVKELATFRNEIQELMKLNVGIIREEAKLKNALSRILELKEEFYFKDNNPQEYNIDNDENIVLAWQVKSSLFVCEAIIRSALMRQESRGAHYRSDFPEKDEENWNVNICCKKVGKEMVLFKQNIKVIKGPLADFIKTHVKAEHQREFE
ncbi:MAG TPA: FAD-binding protein [Nitrososphaeraceae archaeon]|nr:FAD-binding protein [Nitrososphaeraceae archaeon]